jgi:hypothetical protein
MCQCKTKKKWCWQSRENHTGRGSHPNHAFYTPRSASLAEQRCMAMKRPDAAARIAGSPSVTSDEESSLLFPSLWSYLTETVWEDGKARQVATLTVFCEDGLVKICLSDRALERSGWVSAGSLNEALSSLEAKLTSDCFEWRKAMRPAGKR